MKESIQEQKLQQKILEGTIEAFNQKGLKFTMDDLAGILGMSKKTIYTVFSDKTSLFLSMVDYLFDTIKESERAILENEALSTVEKIRAILGVMPDSYKDINFAKLYLLKEKYPEIYTRVGTAAGRRLGNDDGTAGTGNKRRMYPSREFIHF